MSVHDSHVLPTRETCNLKVYHDPALAFRNCPICDGGLSVCRDCGTYEAGLDEPCAATRMPIYLNEVSVVEELPPEKVYSTFPHPGGEILGHVRSEHPLKRSYEGTWGARHESPNRDDAGFYSVHALIRCAVGGRHGLSWEQAGTTYPDDL